MEELEPRLALLKFELESLQTSIRALDTVMFQIKGWCVTAAFAVAGFAVTGKRSGLIFVGLAATIGFWLIDAHHKSIQRVFIERNRALECDILRSGSLVAALQGDNLRGPKIASAFAFASQPRRDNRLALTQDVRRVLLEAGRPLTFGLYLFIAAVLVLEGLILLL